MSPGQLREAAALALGCPLCLRSILLGEGFSDHRPLPFPLEQNQKCPGLGNKAIPEGIMPTRNNPRPLSPGLGLSIVKSLSAFQFSNTNIAQI